MKPQNSNDQKGFSVDLNDPVQLRYLKAMVHREFPFASVNEISAAVDACAREEALSQTRAELTTCVRVHLERLKGGPWETPHPSL